MNKNESEQAWFWFHYGKLNPPRWGAVAFNVLQAGVGIDDLSAQAALRMQLFQVIADWIDARVLLVAESDLRHGEARARKLFEQAVTVFGDEGNPDYWSNLWIKHSEWFIFVTTERAKKGWLKAPRRPPRGRLNRVKPRGR